ncbi:hypothetical protein NG891_17015 [Enterococcus gallinarum]|uniref:hypothetical protein n=1 Tax=Enterococcus gallinarum TaxID=1353 RepID=UPI00098470CD|nr:hypothetical protein [Enterococcus gallinarum]MCO5478433.1 hypothetical protein [Enterococcus gallinarum]OOG23317.1 hypothetical protein BZK37_17760 [Enterococcus casseliflavus]
MSKTTNYTSMFRAPISMQLKFWHKKKKYILPWRLSLQGIITFAAAWTVVRQVISPLLRLIETRTGAILFDFFGSTAATFGLTLLLLRLPLEGKRIDQFVFGYLHFFLFVQLPKKVVYKGEYRKYKQVPIIYRFDQW